MQTSMQREPGGASQITRDDAMGIAPAGNRQVRVHSSADLVELKYRNPANLAAGKFASGLGLFSLGLGLAEALMPGTMAKAIGVDESQSNAIRALGLREIGHGISIMTSQKPTGPARGKIVPGRYWEQISSPCLVQPRAARSGIP